MPCSIDHSTLVGLKFCIECGAPLGGNTQIPQQSYSAPTPPPANGFAPPPPPQSAPYFDSSVPYYEPQPSFFDKFKIPIIAGGSALLVLIAGIFVFAANRVTYTDVTVNLTLYDEYCYDLSWGYYDIQGGDVSLYIDGEYFGYENFPYYGTTSSSGCVFTTYFSNVPMNGSTYEVELNDGDRGSIDNSQTELAGNDWEFDLSMGY